MLPIFCSLLLFYLLFFPSDKIPLDGIKIHADNIDIPPVKQMLFEIFFFLDLFQSRWIVVQLEFKDVDSLLSLNNGINSPVISSGLCFHIYAKQPEYGKENSLKIGFLFFMDIVGDSGKKTLPTSCGVSSDHYSAGWWQILQQNELRQFVFFQRNYSECMR